MYIHIDTMCSLVKQYSWVMHVWLKVIRNVAVEPIFVTCLSFMFVLFFYNFGANLLNAASQCFMLITLSPLKGWT